MIRLNCFLEIADSSFTKKAVETAIELVELVAGCNRVPKLHSV